MSKKKIFKRNYGNKKVTQQENCKGKKTMITAWGETKSFREWFEDPRCQCRSYKTLTNRVSELGWRPEMAIETPTLKGRPLKRWLRGIQRVRWGPREVKKHGGQIKHRIRAWGRTLPLRDWVRQPFIQASYDTILQRIEAGWQPEVALSARPYENPHDPDVREAAFAKTLKERRKLVFKQERTMGDLIRRTFLPVSASRKK